MSLNGELNYKDKVDFFSFWKQKNEIIKRVGLDIFI